MRMDLHKQDVQQEQQQQQQVGVGKDLGDWLPFDRAGFHLGLLCRHDTTSFTLKLTSVHPSDAWHRAPCCNCLPAAAAKLLPLRSHHGGSRASQGGSGRLWEGGESAGSLETLLTDPSTELPAQRLLLRNLLMMVQKMVRHCAGSKQIDQYKGRRTKLTARKSTGGRAPRNVCLASVQQQLEQGMCGALTTTPALPRCMHAYLMLLEPQLWHAPPGRRHLMMACGLMCRIKEHEGLRFPRLCSGQSLLADDMLVSEHCKSHAVMQHDGNFVVGPAGSQHACLQLACLRSMSCLLNWIPACRCTATKWWESHRSIS